MTVQRLIFVGDVHGCHSQLERLLDKVRFDAAADRLLLVGDLVNRGPDSLAVLRLVKSLGEAAEAVLGNHDLHLLAYAHGQPKRPRRQPDFDRIIEAEDGATLLEWLRHRPLIWMDDVRRLAMVHAGIDPRWRPSTVMAHAAEVEHALRHDAVAYFSHMYGNRPRRWRPSQPHFKRLRAITNVLTRMRWCDAKGRLDLEGERVSNKKKVGFRPWFEYRHADWKAWTVVFGHWSMLGLVQRRTVVGLDTGCVWGGALTAMIDHGEGEREWVSVAGLN